jgi:hypothetical protein
MILMQAISIMKAIGRGGLWNQDFLGSEVAKSEASTWYTPPVSVNELDYFQEFCDFAVNSGRSDFKGRT